MPKDINIHDIALMKIKDFIQSISDAIENEYGR